MVSDAIVEPFSADPSGVSFVDNYDSDSDSGDTCYSYNDPDCSLNPIETFRDELRRATMNQQRQQHPVESRLRSVIFGSFGWIQSPIRSVQQEVTMNGGGVDQKSLRTIAESEMDDDDDDDDDDCDAIFGSGAHSTTTMLPWPMNIVPAFLLSYFVVFVSNNTETTNNKRGGTGSSNNNNNENENNNNITETTWNDEEQQQEKSLSTTVEVAWEFHWVNIKRCVETIVLLEWCLVTGLLIAYLAY